MNGRKLGSLASGWGVGLAAGCLLAGACADVPARNPSPRPGQDALSESTLDAQEPRQDAPRSLETRAADAARLPSDGTPGPDAAATGDAQPAEDQDAVGSLPTDGTTVPGAKTIVLSGGFLHVCALSPAGTVACWGENRSGQIGDGTSANRDRPVPVTGLTDVASIGVGFRTSCAVLKNGKLMCWGSGHGNRPAEVAGLSGPVRQASPGNEHRCALLMDGRVMCWGSGEFGKLGNGSTASSAQPVLVDGLTDAVEIGSGVDHSCARRATGAVVCWGSGSQGKLGDGSGGSSSKPVNVATLNDTTQIALGAFQACALRADRSVWCWGRNNRGESGTGVVVAANSPRPVQSLVTNAVQIVAGQHFMCARLASGGAVCWGSNSQGQLGNGVAPADPEPTPQAVKNLTDAVELEAAGYASYAVRQNGEALGWGDNGLGQVGDGTAPTDRYTPVLIPTLFK
jgi:alpha-tubulin suppressor-like RCC1 family protein